MIVDLSDIQPEGRCIEKKFSPETISLDTEEAKIVQPVSLEVCINKVKKGFQFKGSINGHIHLQCARCLEYYNYPISTSFNVIYILLTKIEEDEIELHEEDLNISFIKEDKVDLRGVVREQILLRIPMKPLCSGDCKGLCPECGINLNEKQCDCTKEAIDPRLKPLLKIKNKLQSQ